MSTVDYDYRLKLLLVGSSNVGKSSLLHQYVDNEFNHLPQTIGVDFKTVTMMLNRGKERNVIKLQIWDTAGQERFRTLTSSYYRNTQGILLIYDITSRESFDLIQYWLDEVNLYATPPDPIKLLVGNKTDLNKDRQVPKDLAMEFAKKHGMLFIETSAKNGDHVNDAFEELTHKILDNDDLLENSKPLKTGVIKITEEEPEELGGCSYCSYI